jgi:hypothetical protein
VDESRRGAFHRKERQEMLREGRKGKNLSAFLIDLAALLCELSG